MRKSLHRPGIEPGPPAWQASILPLNQRCYTWKLTETHNTSKFWKCQSLCLNKKLSQLVGFEPTLPEGNWFLVSRLNHSATTAILQILTNTWCQEKNCHPYFSRDLEKVITVARLAQSVEHETLNLRVVGSSPTLGETFWHTFVKTNSFQIWMMKNKNAATRDRTGDL